MSLRCRFCAGKFRENKKSPEKKNARCHDRRLKKKEERSSFVHERLAKRCLISQQSKSLWKKKRCTRVARIPGREKKKGKKRERRGGHRGGMAFSSWNAAHQRRDVGGNVFPSTQSSRFAHACRRREGGRGKEKRKGGALSALEILVNTQTSSKKKKGGESSAFLPFPPRSNRGEGREKGRTSEVRVSAGFG